MTEMTEITVPETGTRRVPAISRVHETIIDQEQREPEMDEYLPVGKIQPGEPEFERLTASGVSPEEIKEGRVKRRDLIKAGFVFNNYPLGHLMEKPLIKGEIDGVNYTDKKLLTQKELEAVFAFQEGHPDQFIPEGVDADDLRQDMLRFMFTAPDPRPTFFRSPVNVLRNARDGIEFPNLTSREMLNEWKRSPEVKTAKLDKRLVDLYWADYRAKQAAKAGKSPEEFNPYLSELEFMAEHCHDIYPWGDANLFSGTEARGKTVFEIDSRKSSLNYFPSPFLDSGFHFPPALEVDGEVIVLGNPDLTVNDPEGVFRVNMMVYHLLSRGLSEMGDSKGVSYDQDYTIGHFAKKIYAQPGGRETQYLKEDAMWAASQNFDKNRLLLALRQRLVEIARSWAGEESAPSEAKRVLKRAQRIEKRNTLR